MQEPHQTSDSSAAVRNSAQLAAWTLAWAGTLALAKFGPRFLWDSQQVASWIAIAANIVVGVGLIVAHARYHQNVDELQRKIMLEALAVTVGVGLVGGFAYAAANSNDLIAFDAEVAYFSALMAVVYLAANIVGNLRYR